MIDLRQDRTEFVGKRNSVLFLLYESPQLCQGPDGRIKGTLGLFGYGEGFLKYRLEFRGYGFAAIGFGEVAVIAMNAQEFIYGADFVECRINRRLSLGRCRVDSDGNKGAEVWLQPSGRLRRRVGRWITLAADRQPPEQGAQPHPNYGRRA